MNQSGKNDGSWKGVIFVGDAGQVYGNPVELTTDAEVPEGKELTQKEVAELLGISQSYISRLEKKIMKRLKKELSRDSY